MKVKLKRIIILLAIILAIFVIIYMTNPMIKVKKTINKINVEDKMNSKLELPENLHLLIGEYKGNLTTEIISKNYNNLAKKVIPKYYEKCKNLSGENLNKYFERNKELIRAELDYSEYNEFETFINYIKKIDVKKLKFESYRLLEESAKTINMNTSIYIEINYKENNTLIFKSIVSNKINSDKTSIKLQSNIDEEIINRDKEIKAQKDMQLEHEKSPFTRGTPL